MSEQKKRLCLIDGSGYIYRAFYALPPMNRPSDGTPVNAVFGFTSMLMQFMTENSDDCIAVVFDTARRNFRNDIYPEYKATRKEVPADLIPQFPLIRDVVHAFDVASVEKDGYEADDLIASYAKKGVEDGYQVVVVSADKDLMQLMDKDKVLLYDPMKKRYVSDEDVIKKFGVLPDKVIQVQSLMGDSIDNIPGVHGIGPKTAAELINKYGSLEEIYNHLNEIPERRAELLKQDKENVFISKRLVVLDVNAPLPMPISDFCRKDANAQKIKDFLQSMGFKSLMGRVDSFIKKRENVLSQSCPITLEASQENLFPEEVESKIERHYECIQEEKDLLKWCDEIEKNGFVALDTETDSLDSQTAEIAGISLCTKAGHACYIPINHCGETTPKSRLESLNLFEDEMRPKQISKEFIKQHLLTLLAKPEIVKIGHNIKFDLEVIHTNFGIDLSDANLQDTIVMAYDLDGVTHKLKLDDLAAMFLNEKMIAYQEVCGTRRVAIYFKQVDLERATAYAAEDADMTLRLYHFLKKRLDAENVNKIYQDADRPLINVLTKMENEGVLVDKVALQKLSFQFFQKIDALEKEIYTIAGEHFNLNSPLQLGEILFEKMAIQGGKRNSKTKNWITDSEVLEELAANGVEIASKLLEYRQYTKLKSTYTDALVKLINPRTGRVHTTFSQTMTATGRLSSNNPNLQNIPIKSEMGREIRAAFIAKAGYTIISADYSQVELRLMADVANVKQLKEDFANDLDIHAATASKVFNVPLENMNPMVRRNAKAINFGIIYGISAFGLARQLGISRAEAKGYIDSYFEKYPEIKKYMDETIQFASENGYVLTPFGRKCFISGFDSGATRGFASRAAINAPIQGGAADIIKMAMIKIQSELEARQMKTKMLLQVHDELIFEVPDEEVEQARALIKDTMENVVCLSVPLVAEVGVGKNWKEAH